MPVALLSKQHRQPRRAIILPRVTDDLQQLDPKFNPFYRRLLGSSLFTPTLFHMLDSQEAVIEYRPLEFDDYLDTLDTRYMRVDGFYVKLNDDDEIEKELFDSDDVIALFNQRLSRIACLLTNLYSGSSIDYLYDHLASDDDLHGIEFNGDSGCTGIWSGEYLFTGEWYLDNGALCIPDMGIYDEPCTIEDYSDPNYTKVCVLATMGTHPDMRRILLYRKFQNSPEGWTNTMLLPWAPCMDDLHQVTIVRDDPEQFKLIPEEYRETLLINWEMHSAIGDILNFEVCFNGPPKETRDVDKVVRVTGK